MTPLSHRYLAALAELSQFECVDNSEMQTLTHTLTGVQVAAEPEGPRDSGSEAMLRLTFSGGHSIAVIANLYLDLQLAEDAAHRLHSVREGAGEIHKRAAQTLEHLEQKHHLHG